LLAIDNVLYRSLLGILTGYHITLDILIGGKSIGNRRRSSIVRGKNGDVALVSSSSGSQVSSAQIFGSVEIQFVVTGQ